MKAQLAQASGKLGGGGEVWLSWSSHWWSCEMANAASVGSLSAFFSWTVCPLPSPPSLLPCLSACSFPFWSVQLHLSNPGAVPSSPLCEVFPGNRQGTLHAWAVVWIWGMCVCPRAKKYPETLHAHPALSREGEAQG